MFSKLLWAHRPIRQNAVVCSHVADVFQEKSSTCNCDKLVTIVMLSSGGKPVQSPLLVVARILRLIPH